MRPLLEGSALVKQVRKAAHELRSEVCHDWTNPVDFVLQSNISWGHTFISKRLPLKQFWASLHMCRFRTYPSSNKVCGLTSQSFFVSGLDHEQCNKPHEKINCISSELHLTYHHKWNYPAVSWSVSPRAGGEVLMTVHRESGQHQLCASLWPKTHVSVICHWEDFKQWPMAWGSNFQRRNKRKRVASGSALTCQKHLWTGQKWIWIVKPTGFGVQKIWFKL